MFSVLESMTYIVELVNRFELAMTDVAAKNLRREACLVMLPIMLWIWKFVLIPNLHNYASEKIYLIRKAIQT